MGRQFTFEELPAAVSLLNDKLDEIGRLLTQGNNNIEDADRWMSMSELIAYLPSKPVRVTVYTWTSRGEIPYHRRGKRLYFLKSEIDAWLKEGRHKTLSELRKEASIPIKTR